MTKKKHDAVPDEKVYTLPSPKYLVADGVFKSGARKGEPNHKYKIYNRSGAEISEKLRGVTTVLSILDKPALVFWAARVAAEDFKTRVLSLGRAALKPEKLAEIEVLAKNAHSRISKEATVLGSACHDIFEAIIRGNKPENVPIELQPIARAFEEYRLQSSVIIAVTHDGKPALELPIGSLKRKFGGRMDYVGYDVELGGYIIGDYKTSKAFYGNDYAYQTAGGYTLAIEEQYGIKIVGAEIVRFDKKPPYSAEARPVERVNIKYCKQAFLACLKLKELEKLELIGPAKFVTEGMNEKPPATPVAKPKTEMRWKSSPVGF